MAPWLGSLVMLLVGTTAMADDPQQRVNQPQALVFERAQAEIALKTEVFQRTVGRGHVDWSVDLDEGVIRFTAPGLAAHAPVQVIGTYNTLDGTFLWAWDHPSIPEARRTDAMLARSFGEHNTCRCSPPARWPARSRHGSSPPSHAICPVPRVPITRDRGRRWCS